MGVLVAWQVGAVRRSTLLSEGGLDVIQSLLEKNDKMSTAAKDALQTVRSLQNVENGLSWTPGLQAALQDTVDKLQKDVADRIFKAHEELQKSIDVAANNLNSTVYHTVALMEGAEGQGKSWYECVEQAREDMKNVIVQQGLYNQRTLDRQVPCAEEIANELTSQLGNSGATDCSAAVAPVEGQLRIQIDWLVMNNFSSQTTCTKAKGVERDQLGLVTQSQSDWAIQNGGCRAQNLVRKAALCQTGKSAQSLCTQFFGLMQLKVQTTSTGNPNSVVDMQEEYSTTQVVVCLLNRLRDSNFTDQTIQDCKDSIDPLLTLDWHDSSINTMHAMAQHHDVTCEASNGFTANKPVTFHGDYWSNQPASFTSKPYTGAVPSPEAEVLESYSSAKDLQLPFTPNPLLGDPFSVCESMSTQ